MQNPYTVRKSVPKPMATTRGIPINARMIPIPPRRIAHKETLFQRQPAVNIQVILVQKLLPHAYARLPVLVVLRRGIYAQRDIELAHDRQCLLFECRQAFGFGAAGFEFGLQADFLLVREDDDLVAGLFSYCTLYRRMGYAHPSAFSCFSFSGTLVLHHFQSEASRAKRFPEEVAINVESFDTQSQRVKQSDRGDRFYQVKSCDLAPLSRLRLG
jgi:hypothetical protein